MGWSAPYNIQTYGKQRTKGTNSHMRALTAVQAAAFLPYCWTELAIVASAVAWCQDGTQQTTNGLPQPLNALLQKWYAQYNAVAKAGLA